MGKKITQIVDFFLFLVVLIVDLVLYILGILVICFWQCLVICFNFISNLIKRNIK